MAAKKRRPAKAHKPVRKPAKKASKARKHVKRPAKAKAHRAAGHGETLHKGPNWVTAREVSGRMHVTTTAGGAPTVRAPRRRTAHRHTLRWRPIPPRRTIRRSTIRLSPLVSGTGSGTATSRPTSPEASWIKFGPGGHC